MQAFASYWKLFAIYLVQNCW